MGQTLTPSHIQKVFDEALNSMPHEFSSKIFAKKTRELGLPKTSYVKNMRTDYLKNKSIRLNRFIYYKGGFEHPIKYKVTNIPGVNVEDLHIFSNDTQISDVDFIVNKIKALTIEEIKQISNMLGWKILVKVETWNEL